MSREQLSPEIARLVTPRALTGYVQGLGWQPVPNGKRPEIAVFHRPDSRLHQLIVPTDTTLDDFGESVIEAVRTLAAFEKRPATEILSHLLLPPADLIRLRESGPNTETGSIPLNHAARLVRGARQALLAVAHSVLVPQVFHKRLSRTEAEDFVSQCRLQTERGSFMLALACPLDLQAGLFAPRREPFARRVTSLFMQSLQELAKAADAAEIGEVDDLADIQSYPGMSANLCESLLLLRPEGERSSLGVSVTWSRAYLPKSKEQRRELNIDQRVFKVAEALAPRLRSLPEPRIARFYGRVDELKGGAQPEDLRPYGEVRFTLFDQDEEVLLHARADLSADDYAEAIDAHRTTELVSFKGILQRLPRLNRVDHITEFKRV
jgi:hypothetical protein